MIVLKKEAFFHCNKPFVPAIALEIKNPCNYYCIGNQDTPHIRIILQCSFFAMDDIL